MSISPLPERPSLEFLKKLAKDRLHALRRIEPGTQLATALLDVARDHGFSSWRALKAHVESLQRQRIVEFFDICRRGDQVAAGTVLAVDAEMARARDAQGTALHLAAVRGHLDVVQLLLRYGADANARDAGDNATPLHFAAGAGHVDIVRLLLEAGADVHGHGALHDADVIGWATSLGAPSTVRRDVLAVLLEHGARHHIFSAIATGDPDVVRHVVEDDPDAMDRRMSRFERGESPLHFAMRLRRYDLLDLLLELGADPESRDLAGRTSLEVAMTKGDAEAMRRLRDAGAATPTTRSASDFAARLSALASSVSKGVPMIYVPDVARALDWYVSIGFKELSRFDDEGLVNFGMVAYGNAELMLNVSDRPAPHDVSLWFYTDRVNELYDVLKSRQIEAAQAELAGGVAPAGVEFEQDLEDMFYGARQFAVRDLNGYQLYFIETR